MRRKAEYWCCPQNDGHPTLYFHDQRVISRAKYVETVGPGDCDPHVTHGRRIQKRKSRAREAR
jgi:hypothetical protein